MKLVLPACANLHDRERDLVAEARRLLVEIAAVEERIAVAQADHLGVGRAETHRVDAHQNLVGAAWGERLGDGRAVDAQPGQTCAAQAANSS